jgi:hypothetical protein
MDRAMYDSLRERYPPRATIPDVQQTHEQILASISPGVGKLFDSTPMERWPELIDAARRRKKLTQREPMGREAGEFTEEDTRRVLDRGTTSITTLDGVGNVTSDPLAMCRPGFRFSDRTASETAYADMCRDLSDAWRPKDSEVNVDALTPQLPPYGWPLWAQTEGASCQIDGRRGVWKREGDYLYCRPLPEGPPPRADAVPRTMDAAQAQQLRHCPPNLLWRTTDIAPGCARE